MKVKGSMLDHQHTYRAVSRDTHAPLSPFGIWYCAATKAREACGVIEEYYNGQPTGKFHNPEEYA